MEDFGKNFTTEEWELIIDLDDELDGNFIPVLQKYVHEGEWHKALMIPKDYQIAYVADVMSDYGITKLFNKYSPNLTVCPCCHVDDFTHVENCELIL